MFKFIVRIFKNERTAKEVEAAINAPAPTEAADKNKKQEEKQARVALVLKNMERRLRKRAQKSSCLDRVKQELQRGNRRYAAELVEKAEALLEQAAREGTVKEIQQFIADDPDFIMISKVELLRRKTKREKVPSAKPQIRLVAGKGK